jgi:regulator of replication initiation timing
MIYKVACGVLLLGIIFLGTRLKVAEDRTETIIEDLSAKTSECIELQERFNSLNAQVDTLLSENSQLLIANNELSNQQPETVIKYVKKTNVNRRASDKFIELLTKRYEFE